MGIGLMYGGLRLRPGDEVLTTEHDFYATHEALRFAALRSGAQVRRVTLYDDPAAASADEIVARLTAAVSPATRVVAITWVHSGTGVKLPVRAIADALADANDGRADEERALLAIDGVHGFGSQPQAVAELGCDLFAAGGHKWVHGPRGTGVLWGSDTGWERLVPIVPTFSRPQYGDWMTGRPAELGAHDWGTTMTPGGYHSFEQRWALAQAFGFHLELGREAVAARIATLTEQLKSGLAGIDGVRVHTPAAPDVSAGIVCFELGEPERTAAALADRGVRVSVAPYATRHLRAGATLLVDEAGIERALTAVRDVAR
jgi:selenocysteine lyase/cysteine desulfurase